MSNSKNWIEENENEKIKHIISVLNSFQTVQAYNQFKKQPLRIDNAQPIDFIDFFHSTMNNEIENEDFEGTTKELSKLLNLVDNHPNERYLQFIPKDWGDSTNATSVYLSEITSDEKLLDIINEALEIDQVTHSSGLQPRYQFIEYKWNN